MRLKFLVLGVCSNSSWIHVISMCDALRNVAIKKNKELWNINSKQYFQWEPSRKLALFFRNLRSWFITMLSILKEFHWHGYIIPKWKTRERGIQSLLGTNILFETFVPAEIEPAIWWLRGLTSFANQTHTYVSYLSYISTSRQLKYLTVERIGHLEFNEKELNWKFFNILRKKKWIWEFWITLMVCPHYGLLRCLLVRKKKMSIPVIWKL